MEGLIAIVVIVPLVMLILLVSNASKLSSLSRDVNALKNELKRQRASATTPPTRAIPVNQPEKRTDAEKPKTEKPQEPEPAKPKVQPTPPLTKPAPRPKPKSAGERRPAPKSVQRAALKRPAPKRKTWFDEQLEKNIDFEKFIGENLMSKIGIAVLVIGMGFFLKLAIDRNYLDETGRVIVGVLSGGLLMFFAHRLRDGLRAFSSVLIGGAITIFYFTFWFAYHEYGIITQTPTFLIMIGITALAVTFSLLYDRKELAVISLIGGFATPFLASSGSGNYVVLFSYLAILNIGMLIIAEYRKWNVINVLSMIFTWVIFAAWVFGDFDSMVIEPIRTAMVFATAFFLIFFAMNMRYHVKHNQALDPLHLALLLGNTGAFYGLGMVILSYAEMKLGGLFTALVGLFYLLSVYAFQREQRLHKFGFYLLIGLVLTFISLVAPVQLEGNHITLFWAAEAVLLIWLAKRSGLTLILRATVVVIALMMISWFIDLQDVYTLYGTIDLRPIINRGFLTSSMIVLSLWLSLRLLQNLPFTRLFGKFNTKKLSTIIRVLFVTALYLTGLYELNYQIGSFFGEHVAQVSTLTYSLLFLLLLENRLRIKSPIVRYVVGGASILGLFNVVTGAYENAMESIGRFLDFHEIVGLLFHFGLVIVTVLLIYRVTQMARELIRSNDLNWRIYLWSMCAYLVVLASQQLDIAMLVGFGAADNYWWSSLNEYRKVGYPILWGVGSFLFMYHGMRQKLKTVRVIALVFFGITLLKLFLYDIQGASEGGRALAFILLGILLLVVSFMYQKIKNLFIDGGSETEDK